MFTFFYAHIPLPVYIHKRPYAYISLTRRPYTYTDFTPYSYKCLHPAQPIYALNMFTYSYTHIHIYFFVLPRPHLPYTCSRTSRSIYLFYFTDFDAHMQPIYVALHFRLFNEEIYAPYIVIYSYAMYDQYISTNIETHVRHIYIFYAHIPIHLYIFLSTYTYTCLHTSLPALTCLKPSTTIYPRGMFNCMRHI